jgi:hypothetical protein
MRTISIALLAFALLILGAPSPLAQPSADLGDVEIQSLSLQIDDEDSAFTVVDSRMDETGTAAVFFGLIGATINSIDNNSEDDAKAEPLKATAEALDVPNLVMQALRARLEARGGVELAGTPDGASHTLIVEIGEWGLVRRASRPSTEMRTFLKLTLRMVDARNRAAWGPQRENSIGPFNAELAEFTPEVFQSEMEALAVRAGEHVANLLIYR